MVYKCYLVGGAVRDKLLGIPVKDQDFVVTGSSVEEMMANGFRSVGKHFPVFLHPDTNAEYALARTERKSGVGYKGFTFYTGQDVTLEEDLQRRDLTINAIAEDGNGNLIDPFNGKMDLEQQILRHVSPAFVEDPLRVLRVARFAARYGFRVADETMALMKQMVATGELNHLVPERVWLETERALAERYPARFILVLRACNALGVLFPEIERLFGVPQPVQYHPEIDTGIHVIMVLQQISRLSKDPLVRFAALVHDLGKGATPIAEWPSHYGHGERGVALIERLCDRLRVPRRYRSLAVLVSRFHIDCHRIMEMKPECIVERLMALDAFRRPERFQQFLLVCRADAYGRAESKARQYPQADYFIDAFERCSAVDVQRLIDDGLSGRELAAALKQQRITTLISSDQVG